MDQNCLTFCWYSQKIILKKEVCFEKESADYKKKHRKLRSMQRVYRNKTSSSKTSSSFKSNANIYELKNSEVSAKPNQ